MVASKLAAMAVAGLSLLASTVVADVDPIVIKGSKFFYKTNGTEFFIKGVAYQQDAGGNGTASTGDDTTINDPLTDSAGCSRDIPLLQSLQTNTIRVYAIDPTQDHDACMTALQNAGIYVVCDLGSPSESINRDSPSWDGDLYTRYTSVIDVMAKYNNVLGFFAGNEVVNNATNSGAMPFVKAAVRDMKAYIKSKNYRTIGVGYAADDDATIRDDVRTFMNCGDAASSIDFFGYNIYSWCGPDSSFEESGYADRTQEFSTYNVPAFFAEYGCNQPPPRYFDDTPVLFSGNMTGVWSGGIVYEYFEASNDFGLVSLNGNSVSKLPDFTQYSKQIASATPTGVSANSYNPTNTAAACPSVGPSWAADASVLPPTPNQQLCNCMVSSLSCVAKSDIDAETLGDTFGFICGKNNGQYCKGITANGTTGTYGAYSQCAADQRLSFVMNEYANAQGGASDACDFSGAATTTSASTASTCSSLLQQAGTDGASTVTAAPSNGGGPAASSSSAASGMVLPPFQFDVLAMGLYATVAAAVGAGMIIL